MSGQTEQSGASTSEYSQLFMYRIPKANHDRFGAVESELAALFRKHGVLGSDFYVLEGARIFGGFRDLRGVLGTTADEEVWVEIDHYRDAADAEAVIAEIGKDASAGPLFAQVLELAVPGMSWPQGNAHRVHPGQAA